MYIIYGGGNMKKYSLISEAILFSISLLVRTIIILRYTLESSTIDLGNTFDAFLQRWNLSLTYILCSVVLFSSLCILIIKTVLMIIEFIKSVKLKRNGSN